MAPADSTTHTNKSGKHGKPDLAATTGAAIEWQEATAKTGDREGLRGSDVIAAFVKHLPNSPGVYRMFNTSGDVLYVGKAKSLKKRVAAYSKLAGHGNRIARMIAETSTMEFVRTCTETEALLLEANLIKRLRPRFNVLLRDDKSFPYIVITDDHEAPGVFKHRGARNKAREYYGPFASAGAVTRTINAMQRVFLLRTCSDSVYESRTRPCLLYQIKRCSAPCTGEVSLSEYEALVSDAKAFLTGRSSRIQETLSRQMQKAADDLDFERAAIYRDRISALSMVQGHQGINPHGLDEADVFAIVEKEGQTCVQVFFFRTGQNWGNRAYFPKADKALDCAEILQAFLAQFYDDKPVPREVLLSHDVAERELLADALTLKAGHRVAIGVPRRGKKVDLVRHAELNAREALERRLAESSTQRKLLEGMAEAFNLGTVPQRIEVYDNSHIMGTSAVGAMIVAGPEGFAKNQYRKFNIKQKDLVPGDDYGMMREVLQRRFSRLLKESAKRASKDGLPDEDDAVMGPWPDVILIDGGQGQLNAVMEVLRELEIEDEVEVAAIAKGPDRDAGREKFFVPGRSSFMLPERDPVLYFVQRLRDEAHRFAIGSHRARRKKTMAANPLDEITGIGPARKRALLHRFGSAKAVSRAALRDLKSVEGISDEMAQAIYDHFHEKG